MPDNISANGRNLRMPDDISANGRNFLAMEGVEGHRIVYRQTDETYESIL